MNTIKISNWLNNVEIIDHQMELHTEWERCRCWSVRIVYGANMFFFSLFFVMSVVYFPIFFSILFAYGYLAGWFNVQFQLKLCVSRSFRSYLSRICILFKYTKRTYISQIGWFRFWRCAWSFVSFNILASLFFNFFSKKNPFLRTFWLRCHFSRKLRKI